MGNDTVSVFASPSRKKVDKEQISCRAADIRDAMNAQENACEIAPLAAAHFALRQENQGPRRKYIAKGKTI